jgi:multimeric flavodoxin WrbA
MKYYFCIGAIFKNENHILKEWIDHYLNRGVDHIYLINDNSTDDYMKTLTPYIEEDKITLYNNEIPRVKRMQVYAYNQYFNKHLKECNWFGIFDLDEFLYSPYTINLKNILSKMVNYDQLLINSSVYIKQPDNVVNSFIYRGEYNSKNNGPNGKYNSFKCIVNTFKNRNKDIILDCHIHKTRNSNLDTINVSFNMNEMLLINHYAIQSLEFWKNIKMTRGEVSMWGYNMKRNIELFNSMDRTNIKDERLKNQNETIEKDK